jgi:hypothetical protein
MPEPDAERESVELPTSVTVAVPLNEPEADVEAAELVLDEDCESAPTAQESRNRSDPGRSCILAEHRLGGGSSGGVGV